MISRDLWRENMTIYGPLYWRTVLSPMNQYLCILKVPKHLLINRDNPPSRDSVLHRYAFHCTTSSRLRAFSFIRTYSYSITAPPTTTAKPPATDQSGKSRGAAAADLGEAVLAGLEVAVLLVALVLEVEAILKQRTLAAASLGSTETGRSGYLPKVALDAAASEPPASLPLLVPPESPLPLEPIGD